MRTIKSAYIFPYLLLLVAIPLASCQTARRSAPVRAIPLPELSEQRKTVAESGLVIRYNRVQTKSPTEARDILRNRRSYFLDFFHNSRDPYFGQLRWPKPCLAKNQIGEIHEEKDSITFFSSFTVDERFNVGICAPDSYRASLLEVYCAEDSSVIEVFVRQETRNSAVPTQMRIRCHLPAQLELQ